MMTFTNPVIIVRHGETEWKRQGKTQGQADSPLTQEGIVQVHELAKNLRDYHFDLIITSPLGRTIQTSEILATELHIATIRQSPNLIERNEGLLQGLTKDKQRQRFPYLFDQTGHLIDDSDIPNAEPLSAFLTRVQKGLNELVIEATSKNVLVITHAGVMQAIEAHLKGIPFGDSKRRYAFCETLKLHQDGIT